MPKAELKRNTAAENDAKLPMRRGQMAVSINTCDRGKCNRQRGENPNRCQS